jgi:hypothetical protein
MGSGTAFQQFAQFFQFPHGWGCLETAVTSRLTEPEWPIASRFAIHGLPAAV